MVKSIGVFMYLYDVNYVRFKYCWVLMDGLWMLSVKFKFYLYVYVGELGLLIYEMVLC